MKELWKLLAVSMFVLPSCSTKGPNGLPDVSDAVSATATALLEAADSFEIMALDPMPRDLNSDPPANAKYLGDYRILGRAMVEAREDQYEVLGLVYKGIRDSEGMVAACFNPRHGIRATKGKESVEVIICYECMSMKIVESNGASGSAMTAQTVSWDMTTTCQAHGVTISR